MALLSFISTDHNIIGHWISIGTGKSKVFLDFNKDNSFKVTVDGKTENEGSYTFVNDIFSMYDNNCGKTIAGKYQIIFYTEDSASFKLIQDSCTDRAGEVNGGIIKRLMDQ